MQYFKNDELENKFIDACGTLFTNLNTNINAFYNDCFNCYLMGELIWDNDLMPLSQAIRREVFRYSFNELFEAWAYAGTFESYLTVFQKIFGDTSTIEFTVPGPGRLQIDIESAEVEEFTALFREINEELDEYVYYDFIDTDTGDTIIFRGLLGIETQYECEKILYTMVPNGIFTEVSLTII